MTQHGPDRLADLFAELDIHPATIEHPPVRTVEEAQQHWRGLEGRHTKNLFLKDNRGGAYHLVTLCAETRADMTALAPLIGARKLSFANADALMEVFGTMPGAVSPLSLVNDTEHRVSFAIERGLTVAARITCHPLRNTATLSLAWADLARLLDRLAVTPIILDLPPG